MKKMDEMVNIHIDLEGEVTETQYENIKNKLPGICANLGLSGRVISNFSIEQE